MSRRLFAALVAAVMVFTLTPSMSFAGETGGGGSGGGGGGGTTPTPTPPPKRPHTTPPPPPPPCTDTDLIMGEREHYDVRLDGGLYQAPVVSAEGWPGWGVTWTPQGNMSTLVGARVCYDEGVWVSPDDEDDQRVVYSAQPPRWVWANGFSTKCPSVGGMWGACRCIIDNDSTIVGPLDPYPGSMESRARDAQAMRAYWRNPTGFISDDYFQRENYVRTPYGVAGAASGYADRNVVKAHCYDASQRVYTGVRTPLIHPGRYPAKTVQRYQLLKMYDVSGASDVSRRRTANGGKPTPGFHFYDGLPQDAPIRTMTLDDKKYVVVPDCTPNSPSTLVAAWPDGGNRSHYDVKTCPGSGPRPTPPNGGPPSNYGSIPRYNFTWWCQVDPDGYKVTPDGQSIVNANDATGGIVEVPANNRIHPINLGNWLWGTSVPARPGTTQYHHRFRLGGRTPDPGLNMSPHYRGSGVPAAVGREGSGSVNDHTIQPYSTVKWGELDAARTDLDGSRYDATRERAYWSMLNVRQPSSLNGQPEPGFGVRFDRASVRDRTWNIQPTYWMSGVYRLTGQVPNGTFYDIQTGNQINSGGSATSFTSVSFDAQLTMQCDGHDVRLRSFATGAR